MRTSEPIPGKSVMITDQTMTYYMAVTPNMTVDVIQLLAETLDLRDDVGDEGLHVSMKLDDSQHSGNNQYEGHCSDDPILQVTLADQSIVLFPESLDFTVHIMVEGDQVTQIVAFFEDVRFRLMLLG